jgi:type I restriction enzyme S subunit
MFVSDKFPTYELDRERVDERYLRWCFRRPELWEQAQAMSTGSAALSKLTLNPPKFLLLEMPLPPLSEQQRVVARIEGLAAAISQIDELRQVAAKQAKALTSSYLTALLSGRGADGTLSEVLVGKPRNGWSAKCDNSESGVPVLTLAAVTGFEYSPSNYKRTSEATNPSAHYWARPGDLLITRSNTPALVGHAAIYDGQPAPCIYPDLMMKLVVDEHRALTRFVWLWLQTTVVRDYIQTHAKGTSSTMKKISQPLVMNIPFPTGIDVNDQRGLVEQFDSAQARLAAVKSIQAETADELNALLNAIVDRAFKGEL